MAKRKYQSNRIYFEVESNIKGLSVPAYAMHGYRPKTKSVLVAQSIARRNNLIVMNSRRLTNTLYEFRLGYIPRGTVDPRFYESVGTILLWGFRSTPEFI